MQKGFSLVFILVSVCFLLVLVAVVMYLQNKYQDSIGGYAFPQSSISPIASMHTYREPVSIKFHSPEPESSRKFVKRIFDPSKKFFNDRDYPLEVLSITDNELVGLHCTPRYEYQTKSIYAYYPEGDIEVNYANPIMASADILYLINLSSQKLPEKIVSDFRKCETEDSQIILIYSEQLGGGGAGKDTYISSLNKDGTLGNTLSIKSEWIAYFSCSHALQFTKTGDFYYQCGGGDGCCGARSIYKINLSDRTVKQVFSCESSVSYENDQGKSVTTCS